MNRAVRLASSGLRLRHSSGERITSCEGARSPRSKAWCTFTATLLWGALVCLIMAPADGWAVRPADMARITLQADNASNQSLLGDVFVEVDGSGNLVVIGLMSAVPSSSTVSFYRDAGKLLQAGTPTSVKASPNGGFPGAGDGLSIVVNPTLLTTGNLYVRIVSPQYGTINAHIPVSVDADGNLVSSAAKDVPVRKIAISAPGNEDLVGYMLLTQRTQNGVLIDAFQGLPGAVPGLSTIVVRQQMFIGNAIQSVQIASLNNSYLPGGSSTFQSNGSIPFFGVSDQNSGNITKDGVGTLDGVLTLTITQSNGTSFTATVQNDISADFSVDAIVDGVNNNNVADAAAGFPFTTTLGFITGSVGTSEVSGGFVNYDNTDSANISADGTFSLNISPFFTLDEPLGENVPVYFTDAFGNVSSQTFTLDTASNLYSLTSDNTPTGIVGTVSGFAEPGAAVIVTSTVFGGAVQDDTLIETVTADTTTGAFTVNVPASPFVNVRAVDRAGNISDVVRVDIDLTSDDVVVDAGSITATFTAGAAIEYTFTGVADSDASVQVIGAAADFTPVDGVSTGDVLDDLPFGGRQIGVRSTVAAAADGSFTVTMNGAVGETLVLQAVDLAGNSSRYTVVNLDVFPTNVGITATVTNYTRGSGDKIVVTVVNSTTGVAIDGLYVNLFNNSTDFRPLTDVNFWMTGFDGVGTGAVTIDIPEHYPDAEVFNSESYITGGYVSVVSALGSEIGQVAITGLDRTGPVIGFSILPEVDIQLVQRGADRSDILNVLNILPATAGAPTSISADAVPYVAILADGNADGEIDVNDPSIVLVDIAPFDSLLSGDLIPGLWIPGVSNIDLGENYWRANVQKVAGYEEVFLALFDMNFNFSGDPIPITLDVRIEDPDTSAITVSTSSVSGDAGSVEAGSSITLYANSALTDFLGATTADETGAFSMTYSRSNPDELFLVATDAAGNVSNSINLLLEVTPPSTFIIADGYGLFHTPDSVVSAAPQEDDLVRAIAPAPGTGGAFYILNGMGTIKSFRPLAPSSGAATEPKIAALGLTADVARDIEITGIAGGVASGYVLLGQGMIIPIGDAPFFGDILDVDNTKTRVELSDGNILFDENGNGTLDVFLNEDTNGNGVLDIGLVEVSPGEFQVVNEDTNGNGVLDYIAEIEINPNDLGVGFGFDAARDLEVVYGPDGTPTGYVMLDSFGALHCFGDTDQILVNSKVDYAFTYQGIELVADGANNVLDFIAVSGTGSVVATPGGALGAPDTTDDGGQPRDDAGDLKDVMNVNLPYFGFDIMRDVEVNPVDVSGNGISSDGSDGYYILDGFGGVHAIGNAPSLPNAPFLGVDIARDLELVVE